MSITLTRLTSAQASRLYSLGNNRGLGYAPYTDVPGPDTVDGAIEAAEADGWEVYLRAHSTSDVTVLRNEDGALLGIGGDGLGNGAWAVPLVGSDGRPALRGVDLDGQPVESAEVAS
jgi:hypothetical protein